MDLLDELDSMAINAAYKAPENDEASGNKHNGKIKICQDRFGYSYEKAVELVSITETIRNRFHQMRHEKQCFLLHKDALSMHLSSKSHFKHHRKFKVLRIFSGFLMFIMERAKREML